MMPQRIGPAAGANYAAGMPGAASLEALDPAQRALLARWLPDARVVANHAWGLVDNAVLEVEAGAARYIVKADGPGQHPIQRELDAHERWLAPLTTLGRAPRLVAADRGARILVTAYVPGHLVLGSPDQAAADTFRQAGRLLALLHDQPAHRRLDPDYEAHENAKVLANLDKDHRIPSEVEARLRALIAAWPTDPVLVGPTHGDWQPRNWLAHDGVVTAIDFGRAALRPELTDWVRLAARDFRVDPARERAFVDGYGRDPREPGLWFRERLREAINTAVWARLVGDESFEAEGHAMIAHLLAGA